ncbi:hypothetical protein RN001_014027 [Aquatica leii]|uniref:CCHC-type domain-containing protein n=1 Tax=Aquatica leii TaxID=1421715 RepID=A0AAN7SCN6_9COLE|nr:hypothetical protein RN001_014027 [Aquatica leii]
MTEQITMSDVQFQALLESIRVTNAIPVTKEGNFSKCASRFDGKKDSDVNAFIDAIETYKECTNVSDTNALRGLPMLLDGFAASWWQGVKDDVNADTWPKAVDLLRLTFGPKKPAYRVYRELFSLEQSAKTPTDVFVCNCRQILAHLPRVEMTVVEKRVFEDKKPGEKPLKDPSASKVTGRCRYCKVFGHSTDECKKLARKAIDKSEPTTSLKTESISQHVDTTLSSTISCFGCGTPGYVRSKCPKCNVSESASASINFSEFSVNAISPSPRPIVFIDVFNSHGFGILDTGAKQSVASQSLSINCY